MMIDIELEFFHFVQKQQNNNVYFINIVENSEAAEMLENLLHPDYKELMANSDDDDAEIWGF
jgi:hypothetical protein